MKLIANMHAARAFALQTSRKDDAARPLYERAYREGTNNSAALAAYSLMLLKDGEFQKALDVATAARKVATKPKAIFHARGNRGLAYWKMGKIDEALRIYERLFAESQSGTVYGTLGFLYIAKGDRTGDYEQALDFNRKAVEYDDEDAVVLDNLAQTLMRTGEWEEAEEYFRKALSHRRDQFDSLACLAKCLMRRGELDEARDVLSRALERPFSHLNTFARSEAEEMMRRLNEEGGIPSIQLQEERVLPDGGR